MNDIDLKIVISTTNKEFFNPAVSLHGLRTNIEYPTSEELTSLFEKIAQSRQAGNVPEEINLRVSLGFTDSQWLKGILNKDETGEVCKKEWLQEISWYADAARLFLNGFLPVNLMNDLYSDVQNLKLGWETLFSYRGGNGNFVVGRDNPYSVSKFDLSRDEVLSIDDSKLVRDWVSGIPGDFSLSGAAVIQLKRQSLNEIPSAILAQRIYPSILRRLFTFPGYRERDANLIDGLLNDQTKLHEHLDPSKWDFGIS